LVITADSSLVPQLPIHSECGGGGDGGGNDGVGGGGESDVEEKMLLVSTRITNIHILLWWHLLWNNYSFPIMGKFNF
jgi:hypothetical protein